MFNCETSTRLVRTAQTGANSNTMSLDSSQKVLRCYCTRCLLIASRSNGDYQHKGDIDPSAFHLIQGKTSVLTSSGATQNIKGLWLNVHSQKPETKLRLPAHDSGTGRFS